jgi:hypothetical protein
VSTADLAVRQATLPQGLVMGRGQWQGCEEPLVDVVERRRRRARDASRRGEHRSRLALLPVLAAIGE